MLRLNDDCLTLIFRYLDLREQLIMTKVCERFRDIIVASIWSSRYRQVYTETEPFNYESERRKNHFFLEKVQALKKEEFEEFFRLNTENLQELNIDDTTRKAFSSYLGRHLDRPDFTFYFSFKYLKLIELTCYEKNVHDGHIRILTDNCPQLEVLTISSRYVTGRYLKNFRFLKCLSASHCNLKCEYLNEIIAELNCLKSLSLIGNPELEQNVVNTWASTLLELRLSEKQFHRQFSLKKFFEGLGVTSSLKVFVSFNDDEDFDGMIRIWDSFFENHGKSVKVFQGGQCSSAFNKALEYNYSVNNLSAFPLLEELHLADTNTGDRLKKFLSSTQLRSFYIYNNFSPEEILQLVRNNPNLNFISFTNCLINDARPYSHYRVQILKFINGLLHLLKTLPDRPCINVQLEVITNEQVNLFEELKNIIEADTFREGSRLKLEGNTNRHKSDYIAHNNLVFMFHDKEK